jgi:hypothetical protein
MKIVRTIIARSSLALLDARLWAFGGLRGVRAPSICHDLGRE